MKIDEVRFAILQHDVARLEITIEEGVCLLHQQIVCQLFEILLQFELVELDTFEFEETVFEVVEVEHHACPVHLLLREAMREEL